MKKAIVYAIDGDNKLTVKDYEAYKAKEVEV